jgi:hypothetical protein
VAALKRAMARPAFVVAVVVLGIAAVGLNAAVGYLQLHFKKQPVPLSVYGKPLATLPAVLGHWRQISFDQALDKEVQDVLGTDQYIFREYADERLVGKDRIENLRDLRSRAMSTSDPAESKRLEDEWARSYSRMRSEHPDAVVNVAMTYYTGMVDTVAHVPDRCVVADGYEPTPADTDYADWTIGPDGRKLRVKFVNYEDQTGARRMPRSIAYFFQVNGEYEASHLDVRRKLQNLFQRYGYYAKVEIMTSMSDRHASAKVMTDFLSAAMPEIEQVLPDWQRVMATEQVASAQAAPRPVNAAAPEAPVEKARRRGN